MARAVAKVTAHAGGGAENAAYIGRPQEERSREAEPRLGDEPSAAGRGESFGELHKADDGESRGHAGGRGDDPVWGWNVPWFVTGEAHGVWEREEGRALLESRSLALPVRHLGFGPAPPSAEKLSVGEKRENLIAHFSALADFEERKRGLSHFRLILTVGPEVTNQDLRAMTNEFLRANFPLCPAFVAVHDDTEHRHAHVYVHARQLDNRRVNLKQDYFRLDESWMEVCAKHLDDREIYERHISLKEETLRWKERVERAHSAGKPSPPKPDRWGDHHDTLLVFRPFDDRWCGRLRAQARVAEKRVEWLAATKARPENVVVAREEAVRLRVRLDEAAEKRERSKSKFKRGMPAEVVTVSEARELLLYERDIQKAAKGKGSHGKQSVPELTAEHGTFRFDDTGAGRGSQLGFDFTEPAAPARAADPIPPDARAERSPSAREHVSTRKTPLPTGVISGQTDEAARSLGRELVAEVKLAHTEARLSAKASPKERRRLKEQLIEDRREYARAREEASRHRALLAAWGDAQPPYRLKDDERSYLKFMAGRVPKRLRGRIEAEAARAEIITEREDEILTRHADASAPPAPASRLAPAEAKRTPLAADGRPGGEAVNTKREEPAPDAVRPVQVIPTLPSEPARAGDSRMLPDDEVRKLTLQYELAQARARALRAAEADFSAAPHRWVSPKYKDSLAGLEEKIARGPERGADVGGLRGTADRVRDELAAERIGLPMHRLRAEDEARSLEARLRHEAAGRARLGLEMPDVIPSAEELRELAACAEAARDARQLRRVFEAERDRALREAGESGSGEPVRLLEERYAGVKLVADVRADRGKVALAQVMKEPDKTLLPTTDEAGRDAVATLEQAGTGKGVKGVLSRLVESDGRRRLREQLTETKDAYLGHLRADSEGKEAFREAAGEIMRECRELGMRFGYYAPAVPELSPEQIREVREYAGRQTGAQSERWMADCAQSQKLKDERELAAFEARRAERTVEIFLPGTPAGEERAELIRREIEDHRHRALAEDYERVNRLVADRDRPGRADEPGRSQTEPDRGDGGYFSR